jgi:hypothetical protein
MSKKAPTVREIFFGSETSSEEQRLMEQEFFARVLLPNGTFKTTYPNRLDDINQVFLRHLVNCSDRPIKIMDVGASSGLSTVEWYGYLSSFKVDCDITAADLIMYATVVTLRFMNIAALVNANGDMIHFDLFGTGWSPQPKRRPVHLNTLRTFVIRTLFRAAETIDRTANGFLLSRQTIALLTREFSPSNKLHVVEDDLLAKNRPEFCRAFDVIRAANILNLSYFPVDVLGRMLITLKQRLKANGRLIVVRTDLNGENNASLFVLSNNRFVVADRFGKGSEIEALIGEI